MILSNTVILIAKNYCQNGIVEVWNSCRCAGKKNSDSGAETPVPALFFGRECFQHKISTLLVALACASQVTAATYYVDPSGNDSLTSSQAQSISTPWQTIQKAANNMVAGDTCLIRAGTYRETVTVPASGTATAPITFQPYSSEIVIISGSQPITAWTLESTNIYRATNMPAGWSTLGNRNQVFQSGVMKPEARWPNAGSTFPWQNSSVKPSPDWAYVGSVTYSSNTNGQAVDLQLPSHPDGYWTNATLHMMSGYGWVMECPIVTGYTDATKTLQFVHDDWGGGADNAFNVTAGNEFYLTGIKGEMDSPGEWFYDTTTSRLCFYSTSPPTNVEVKQRAYGFDLSNRSFINLANLQFFACTIKTSSAPSMTTDCTLDGLTMTYLNHSSLTDAASGLNLGSRCVLRNSELSFASGGLVYMNGSDVRVINNKLHDALYSPTFQGGIACSDYGADGNAAYRNLISHNTIYNFGRAAIGYPGRAPIIEYNDIHDGMILASDGGLCYWAKDGCNGIIRYNLIHDAQGPAGHLGSGVMGFYIDNENSGWVAHHNVIWNISGTAMQNNARNNFDMIFNNTCWNCGAGSISTGFWSDGPTGGKYFNNLFNGVPSGNQQPWKLSDARYNLYTNPSFVDPSSRNFQLQATSPAIDQGKVITGITDGYLGSAPDMGALEYGAADWTGSAGYHSTPPSPDPAYAMPAMNFGNQLQDGSFETGNLGSYWTLASGSNAGLIQGDAWGDDHLRSSYFSVQFGGGTSQLSQAVTGLMPHQQYNFYCGVEKTDPTAVVTLSVKTNGLPDQTITVPTTAPWQQQAYQPVPTMFAVPFFTTDGNATVYVTVTRTDGSAIVPAGATTAASVTTVSGSTVYPSTGVYVDDLAVLWSQGQPAIVLNEGFDYPTGTLDGTQNSGSGFATGSNWGTSGADIVTGLTYGNLTSNGTGAIRPSGAGIHSRPVSPSFGGSTFYMSMLINANSHGTGRFGLGMGSGSGPMFGRVSGGWGMSTGTNGSLGISNTGGDNQTWTGVTAAADSMTHLIVVKVDYETNALRLYVDPTPGAAEPTPSATLTSGGGWTINLNSDLWSAISLVHDLADMTADELRIGRAWSDVTPADPNPIVEGFDYLPSTVNGTQNGGLGFATGSSWASSDGTDTIVTGLTYPGMATVGKGALRSSTYGSNERASAAPFGGQTFYLSMLINAGGHETARFGFELRNGEGPMFGRVTGGWGVFSGSNGGMGILNTLGSYQTWTGVAAAADAATHLLVYKVDYKSQSIKMFVDPTPGAVEPAPTATLTTGGNWTINPSSDIWTGVRLFHENAGMTADELHIGNSWSEVVPQGPYPLPLPSVEEGFNYSVGSTLGDGTQNGGSGFVSGSGWGAALGGGSGDYTTITTGLSYPGLASAGAGAIKSVGWAGNTRWLATPLGSGIFYMSMLLNAHSSETNRFGFSLGNDGGGPEFGRVNGGWGMFAGANGEFGISNSTGNYKSWKGITATADSATHLLVYKFDYTAKTINMWVDPTLGTGTGMPTPNATLATGGNWTVNLGTTFNSVRCFHEASNQIADELRIGSTWNEVVPSPYSSWALGYGLNPQTTGAADAISIPNGMPNGILFATGGNPNVFSPSSLPTASITGTNVVFVYPLADAAASLNPVVQISTSLASDSWTDVSSGIVVENGYYGTGLSRVTVTIPSESYPQLFTRLKVSVP